MTDPTGSRTPEAKSWNRLHGFHELMRHRVQRILLVSSLYESFIMSEEGHLQESLLSQFLELQLWHFPDLIRVSNLEEALESLSERHAFDLVITSTQAGDLDASELACELKKAGHELPVLALAYTGRELQGFVDQKRTEALERIFLWQGDVRVLVAMVKVVEDLRNAPNDVGELGVPAVIVIEDSIRYYSSFLPAIYSEVYRHTNRLLSEGLNVSQKMLRMRARPKVLLACTAEEGWELFERYERQVLGIISDFEFPVEGRLDPQAGRVLCRRALERRPDLRIVLQSSDPLNEAHAERLGASFLLKGSPSLLHDLRAILVERFGFGDFIFRLPGGEEVDRASDLRSLADKLLRVPAESIAYHAEQNHFSNWLKARTEFDLAQRLGPRKVEDFESVEDLREHLIEALLASEVERRRTVIADFERDRFEPTASITRIGTGSLGGKARGIAFANRVLRDSGLKERFAGVKLYVPPSVVIATKVFERFLEHPWLRDFAIGEHPDEEILERFLEAPFPRQEASHLLAYLQRVRVPLAVRSSSLLEDSLSQPFAGVYDTWMLPNNDFDVERRWQGLAAAIKRVYASTFLEKAKSYLSMTSFRLEEEKMAVIIQELVGLRHGDGFYPDFAGVARSHNFYPAPGQCAEDGVAAVALGLGRTVVAGRPALRFCPRAPKKVLGFSSVDEALANSQREFFAVDLEGRSPSTVEEGTQLYPLERAEQDGVLQWLGSTFSADDNRLIDGIAREGVRLVSFAQVLKHGLFPLPEILTELLERCSQGMGSPVEIEFAGNLARPDSEASFALLQMRPLSLSREGEEVAIGRPASDDVLCESSRVLGNGRIDDIRDVVVVDREGFDRSNTPLIAQQVARFDALLRKAGRPYLLVGVGRWGSSDPKLGIPVSWNQIAGVRVIVEAGFRDIVVEPSQGTHFFQNLTSSSVGYFTVNPQVGEGRIDWEWLAGVQAQDATEFVRHLLLPGPILVKMDGRSGEGVILKSISAREETAHVASDIPVHGLR